MALTTRLPGWEERLAEAIEAARGVPYRLGEADCFWLACAAVRATTGVDHWPAWRGRYATRREAWRLIREYDPAGFTAAYSRLFGSKPAPMGALDRGDIAEYVDREPHLGVVIGARVAVYGEAGLAFVPRSACRHGWRIGHA